AITVVAVHPDQVWNPREHHCAIRDRLGKVDLLPVYRERNITHEAHVEAGSGDDDVGIKVLAGFEQQPAPSEVLDLVGSDRRFSFAYRLEQISVGNEADPLLVRLVGRSEMGLDIVVRAKSSTHLCYQFLLQGFRLFSGTLQYRGTIADHFPT